MTSTEWSRVPRKRQPGLRGQQRNEGVQGHTQVAPMWGSPQRSAGAEPVWNRCSAQQATLGERERARPVQSKAFDHGLLRRTRALVGVYGCAVYITQGVGVSAWRTIHTDGDGADICGPAPGNSSHSGSPSNPFYSIQFLPVHHLMHTLLCNTPAFWSDGRIS